MGVATDLNHIDSACKVFAYLPENDGLQKTLTGADIVVIPVGIARKPAMTRDDLFKINAGVIRDLLTGVASYSPKAFICIITNPVNSTVPIAVEVLKKYNVFDASKVFSVTTLDVVRASTFTAQAPGLADPRTLKIPVVGGHSGPTILPLLSQSQPAVNLTKEQLDAVIYRVQLDDEIVKAKAGAGSAMKCMAYAGFRFLNALIRAIQGELDVREESYIYLPGVPGGQSVATSLGVDYFTVPVDIDKDGVKQVYGIGRLSDYERTLLTKAVTDLRADISKGAKFMQET